MIKLLKKLDIEKFLEPNVALLPTKLASLSLEICGLFY